MTLYILLLLFISCLQMFIAFCTRFTPFYGFVYICISEYMFLHRLLHFIWLINGCALFYTICSCCIPFYSVLISFVTVYTFLVYLRMLLLSFIIISYVLTAHTDTRIENIGDIDRLLKWDHILSRQPSSRRARWQPATQFPSGHAGHRPQRHTDGYSNIKSLSQNTYQTCILSKMYCLCVHAYIYIYVCVYVHHCTYKWGIYILQMCSCHIAFLYIYIHTYIYIYIYITYGVSRRDRVCLWKSFLQTSRSFLNQTFGDQKAGKV